KRSISCSANGSFPVRVHRTGEDVLQIPDVVWQPRFLRDFTAAHTNTLRDVHPAQVIVYGKLEETAKRCKVLIDGCRRGSIRDHLVFVREHVSFLDMAQWQLAIQFRKAAHDELPFLLRSRCGMALLLPAY